MVTTGVIIAVGLSAGVGLSLGLIGGGGSIITVPILVYVAGLAPGAAVAVSLPIVGATAAVGGWLHYRAGGADVRAAAMFASTGMAGALLGGQLTPLVPAPVLLVLFAALLVVVGGRMMTRATGADEDEPGECRRWRCGAAGLGVGILTGFLGVGGGFLIVPALLRFGGMSMRRAVGTSLLVIAANSGAGAVAHGSHLAEYAGLAATFTLAALLGLAVGVRASRRLRPRPLRVAFAGLALAAGLSLFAANLEPLWVLVQQH